MKRDLSKKHSRLLLIIITVLCVFFLGIIALIIKLIITPININNVPISYSVNYSVNPDNSSNGNFDIDDTSSLHYYATVEEAIADQSLILADYRDTYSFVVSGIIKTFESNDASIIVYLPQIKEYPSIVTYVLIKKDGMYSQVYKRMAAPLKYEKAYPKFYIYDEECYIADRIICGTISENLAKYHDGIPIYYGILQTKNADSITIQGKHPSEVIPVKYGNAQYYYWYYDNISLQDILNENIDFSEFTLQQIIDLFNITVKDN